MSEAVRRLGRMDVIWIVVAVVALLVVVLVVGAALRAMTPKVPSPAAPTTAIPVIRSSPESLPAATRAEIDRLVASGQKIAAIKVLRDATGSRLQDAKDAIDRWVLGAAPSSFPSSPPSGRETGASSGQAGGASVRASLPDPVALEIDRLVAADQKVAAIKLLRDHSGLGLKESKLLIDSWTPGLG